jgi:hypothetical protein
MRKLILIQHASPLVIPGTPYKTLHYRGFVDGDLLQATNVGDEQTGFILEARRQGAPPAAPRIASLAPAPPLIVAPEPAPPPPPAIEPAAPLAPSLPPPEPAPKESTPEVQPMTPATPCRRTTSRPSTGARC